MALKHRARAWLAAAPDRSVGLLNEQVEALGTALAQMRDDAAVGAAQHAEQMEVLRNALDRQRDEARALHARLDRQEEAVRRLADDLAGLQQRVERAEADGEAGRTRLAGLVEQWRWDSDDLRKAVAALAERVEMRSGAAGSGPA